MSSATSTDRFERRLLWLAGASVLLAGWIGVLAVNHWRFTAPVFFLCLGWAALVGGARLLWASAVSLVDDRDDAAAPDDEEDLGDGGDARRRELMHEKRGLLKAIKEVEFDRDMGKVSAADADSINRIYRARAIEIMRQLDRGPAGEPATGAAEKAAPSERAEDVAAVIRRELAARMGDPPAGNAQGKDKAKIVAVAAVVCGSCAASNDTDALFCKKCGARLRPEAEA